MKPNPTRSALLVIDMENGFVHPEGGHWIRFAQSMVPNCVRAVELARAKGIPVFFVKRLYRADGSDVELTRYPGWVAGGRACRPASTGPNSAQAPEGLRPQPGDYTIIKPRWSAFFQTELDLILRRLDVRTVILTGTTTPNCIRTTCYDAIALEYNTVVLTDCCSSHTEEIQRVNLEDMARAGAILMDSASFADYGPGTVEDLSAAIRARMLEEDTVPEPFRSEDGQVFWPTSGNHKGKRTPSAQLRRASSCFESFPLDPDAPGGDLVAEAGVVLHEQQGRPTGQQQILHLHPGR